MSISSRDKIELTIRAAQVAADVLKLLESSDRTYTRLVIRVAAKHLSELDKRVEEMRMTDLSKALAGLAPCIRTRTRGEIQERIRRIQSAIASEPWCLNLQGEIVVTALDAIAERIRYQLMACERPLLAILAEAVEKMVVLIEESK